MSVPDAGACPISSETQPLELKKSHVLRLGSGERHCGLPLTFPADRPRHSAGTHRRFESVVRLPLQRSQHSSSLSRSPWTHWLIPPACQSALQVPEHSLGLLPVYIRRSGHVPAHVADGHGDVWPGAGRVTGTVWVLHCVVLICTGTRTILQMRCL